VSLIVAKFGGSSVANKERVFHAAEMMAAEHRKGHDVVVVVSAQGDTTDDFIEKINEINDKASNRERDVILSAGEQISMALFAMALEKLGCPVISLTGWQAGIKTDAVYSGARIKRVDTDRILCELDKKKIVVVAGFQGINNADDITTLGRGGSDTTAVAIAAALKADECRIYTDVDGVYTADPRIVKSARKLEEISYDEMLEMAALGAQVLHTRCIILAKKYNLNLEVLSSFTGAPGTKVKEVMTMEKMLVSGVTKDENTAMLTVMGLEDMPGAAYKLFSMLAAERINIDVIVQSALKGEVRDISFTVPLTSLEKTMEVLKKAQDTMGFGEVLVDDNIGKVSIVGAGMADNPGVATKMFEALYDAGINLKSISTSEIKVTVLIRREDTKKAVEAIHNRFFG